MADAGTTLTARGGPLRFSTCVFPLVYWILTVSPEHQGAAASSEEGAEGDLCQAPLGDAAM